jgi:hypothetical protein
MEKFFHNEDIDITKFTISHCPFLILIDHHRKTLEAEFRNIGFRKPSNTFFPTMRHILDSKWNDTLLSPDPRVHTRFPDFTYAWLMNFTVDIVTKNVRPLNEEEVHSFKYKNYFLA